MPTPFYHLRLADDLLQYSELPAEIGQFLRTSQCVYLYGNTAPDVQVVSLQPRQRTHFFTLPIQDDAPLAWELMLVSYPILAQAEHLPRLQAAFLAGYLCHLQADWLWVKDIFTPAFGPLCTWKTFRERLYLHNVLRAYLDKQILPELHSGMDACLSRVNPAGWLPFVKDDHLLEWRNLLFPQLQEGAATRTVEVFSARGGISAYDFYAILDSEERMQEEVFAHLPKEQVNQYHQKVLEENSRLLSDYLAFTLHPIHSPAEGNIYQGVQP